MGLVVGLGALLGYSLYHRHAPVHTAVSTSAAGVVTLVPEGLMVLVSLTYAAAAVRMSRRGVLAQQLNAIESLASVDTICVDKRGTLTGSALRVAEAIPCEEVAEPRLTGALATLAAGASTRNLTLRAIADAYPADTPQVSGEVPFSSRRRWSASQTAAGTFYLGAPGRIPDADGGRRRAPRTHLLGSRHVLFPLTHLQVICSAVLSRPPWGLERAHANIDC